MELSRIEVTELPKMLVASYEVTSGEPEQEVGQYMDAWLEKRDLYIGENGVRTFGFDCHKGRSIPRGCRIYHMYASLPKKIDGDDAVEVKEFPGGKFAKIVIRDPFSGDFPSVWEILLKWTFENKIENRLGCKTPDDCYSFFSCEESPCLEEVYFDQGIQYMAMYLPIC